MVLLKFQHTLKLPQNENKKTPTYLLFSYSINMAKFEIFLYFRQFYRAKISLISIKSWKKQVYFFRIRPQTYFGRGFRNLPHQLRCLKGGYVKKWAGYFPHFKVGSSFIVARGRLKDINYQLMLYMEGVKREFKLIPPPSQIGKVDILFRQIATLIKVRVAIIFGLQTL